MKVPLILSSLLNQRQNYYYYYYNKLDELILFRFRRNRVESITIQPNPIVVLFVELKLNPTWILYYTWEITSGM